MVYVERCREMFVCVCVLVGCVGLLLGVQMVESVDFRWGNFLTHSRSPSLTVIVRCLILASILPFSLNLSLAPTRLPSHTAKTTPK